MNRKKSCFLFTFICLFNFSFFYLCHSMEEETRLLPQDSCWVCLKRCFCGGNAPRDEETGDGRPFQPVTEIPAGDALMWLNEFYPLGQSGEHVRCLVAKVDLDYLEHNVLGAVATKRLRSAYGRDDASGCCQKGEVSGDFFLFKVSNSCSSEQSVNIVDIFSFFNDGKINLEQVFGCSRFWSWMKFLGALVTGSIFSLGYNYLNVDCVLIKNHWWEGFCFTAGGIFMFLAGLLVYGVVFKFWYGIKGVSEARRKIKEIICCNESIAVPGGVEIKVLFFLPPNLSHQFQQHVL